MDSSVSNSHSLSTIIMMSEWPLFRLLLTLTLVHSFPFTTLLLPLSLFSFLFHSFQFSLRLLLCSEAALYLYALSITLYPVGQPLRKKIWPEGVWPGLRDTPQFQTSGQLVVTILSPRYHHRITEKFEKAFVYFKLPLWVCLWKCQ